MNYHVVPRLKGWAVRRSLSTRATRRFASRDEAVAFGRHMARRYHGALFIHARDGVVEAKEDYS